MFGSVIRSKLSLRHGETRYCLQNVIETHRKEPLVASRQLFWIEALVPRVLWADKPDLSKGQDYATKYCNNGPKGQHTASITLLGQPLIEGGRAGLLLHGGLLIACLGGITWLGRRPERLSTMVVVALLPWLIDIEQDFALYVANAVKFFLVMVPLVAVVIWMQKRPG